MSFVEPTLDAATASIERLQSADLLDADYDELDSIIRQLLAGYTVEAPLIPDKTLLFRGTTRFQSEPPKLIRDMAYPPPFCCRLGRANMPGKPVLYCSAGADPVYHELHAAPGIRFSIITYETQRPFVVQRLGYTNEIFEHFGSSRNPGALAPPERVLRSPVGTLLAGFFSKMFTEDIPDDEPWRYGLTASIAERFLGKGPLDGLLYPSVAMKGNADNVALVRSCANADLVPKRVLYTEVTMRDRDTILFDTLNEAREFGPVGEIRWLGHEGDWKLRQQGEKLLFRDNGHYWEAFSPEGRLVHPE